jgi:hypothetical protein
MVFTQKFKWLILGRLPRTKIGYSAFPCNHRRQVLTFNDIH